MRGSKPTAATFRNLSFAYFFTFLTLLSVGGIFLSHTLLFLNHAEKTQGEVVELVYGRSIRPRIEFKSEDGETHRFLSHTGSSTLPFEVGDEVTIFYNPKDPAQARWAWFPALWLLPTILGGIGSLFLLLSISFFGVYLGMKRKSLTKTL